MKNKLFSKLKYETAKKIVISGPSGFLGSKVVDLLTEYNHYRISNSLEPNEIILLSSSPGKMMDRLTRRYQNTNKLQHVRASRVDYYTQHSVQEWIDHLGSLGSADYGNGNSVFINLAGVSGPVTNRPDAMMDVNYRATIASAEACEKLNFSHYIQGSSQAVNAERAGQVPYSRGKSMADFHISNLNISTTILCLSLLYCKHKSAVGQETSNEKLNLMDLALLPLTPILGNGKAPIQPIEVNDVALRIVAIAVSSPSIRLKTDISSSSRLDIMQKHNNNCVIYDCVGPNTLSFEDLLSTFARNKNYKFRPVHIGYRGMEKVLNVKGIGNLNRQFVSLLRSEQETARPIVGDPSTFENILGPEECYRLTRFEDAFPAHSAAQPATKEVALTRMNILKKIVKYVVSNPRVILPGLQVSVEILQNYYFGKCSVGKR